MSKTWLRYHLWGPLIAFLIVFAVLEFCVLDPAIAHAWYYDESSGMWAGAGPGAWWARDVLHTGGRWFVRCIAAAAILSWALSFKIPASREWRRTAGFVALAIVSSTAIVGALKGITNVDCPWDLASFGGHNPYVTLFGDRPGELPRAKCFPGAHASSGFALMCFYFALLGRNVRVARRALLCAIAIGIVFSVGQEARGAHFFSHDLVSAALVWFIQLALYVGLLRPSAEPETV